MLILVGLSVFISVLLAGKECSYFIIMSPSQKVGARYPISGNLMETMHLIAFYFFIPVMLLMMFSVLHRARDMCCHSNINNRRWRTTRHSSQVCSTIEEENITIQLSCSSELRFTW